MAPPPQGQSGGGGLGTSGRGLGPVGGESGEEASGPVGGVSWPVGGASGSVGGVSWPVGGASGLFSC